jgi:hypothetical protein
VRRYYHKGRFMNRPYEIVVLRMMPHTIAALVPVLMMTAHPEKNNNTADICITLKIKGIR